MTGDCCGDSLSSWCFARSACHLFAVHITLIAALGESGLFDEARATMADALGRFGDEFRSRMSSAATEILSWRPEDREHLMEGWRKAGVLEN
jgi:hypothetical protein